MLYILIEILLSFLLLIPVFVVLNKVYFHNNQRSLLYLIFATYLASIYLIVGLPTIQFIRFELSLTLIPFLPMLSDLKNTMLNILLFVPLGVMLPFLWKKYKSLTTTLLFGFFLSLSIELLQIFTYRATDINDIITNTIGTLLGYLVFRGITLYFPSIRNYAGKINNILVIILPFVLVMFFLQPYLAGLFYKIT